MKLPRICKIILTLQSRVLRFEFISLNLIVEYAYLEQYSFEHLSEIPQLAQFLTQIFLPPIQKQELALFCFHHMQKSA